MPMPCRLLAVSLLATALAAQTTLVTFEEPGLVAMSNSPGSAIPVASRLTNQLLASKGVLFSSTGGYAGVVVHGANTPSVPNIIGGSRANGLLDYREPIEVRFFDPANPTVPAVTNWVQIRGDLSALGSGTVTMNIYGTSGLLLGSVTDTDNHPGVGPRLTFAAAGIHRIVFSGTSGTVGFDNLEFQPLMPVAGTYTTYGNGCAGTLGAPTLAARAGSRPVPGSALVVDLGHLPNGAGILITGLSNQTNGSAPLPLSLTPFGMIGCQLWTEAMLTNLLVGSGTTATWTLLIPSSPGLLGLQFYNQGAAFDAAANPAGLTLTNAGAATIGL